MSIQPLGDSIIGSRSQALHLLPNEKPLGRNLTGQNGCEGTSEPLSRSMRCADRPDLFSHTHKRTCYQGQKVTSQNKGGKPDPVRGGAEVGRHVVLMRKKKMRDDGARFFGVAGFFFSTLSSWSTTICSIFSLEPRIRIRLTKPSFGLGHMVKRRRDRMSPRPWPQFAADRPHRSGARSFRASCSPAWMHGTITSDV